MASTLFSRLSPQATQPQTNDTTGINNLINQILSSANPQEQFKTMLSQNKDAQNAMDIINQYGNGDPKAAFMNYMAAQGKQQIGQGIMQRLGLGGQ